MPDTAELLADADRLLIANYARRPIVMDHGEGVYVTDTDGKRYLDLFAGFGGVRAGATATRPSSPPPPSRRASSGTSATSSTPSRSSSSPSI